MFPEPADRAKALGVYTFVAAGGGAIGLLTGACDRGDQLALDLFRQPADRCRDGDPDRQAARRRQGPRARERRGPTRRSARRQRAHDRDLRDPPGRRPRVGVDKHARAGCARDRLARPLCSPTGPGTKPSRAAAHLPFPDRVGRQRNPGADGSRALRQFFLGALYLQRVLGYGAIEVGLAFLPVALIIGAMSVGVSARFIVRLRRRGPLAPRTRADRGRTRVLARLPFEGSYARDVLPVMLLIGVGGGLVFPSIFTLALSSAGPTDSGLASGLVNTSQQVGGALGLAVLASLSTTRSQTLLDSGDPSAPPRSPTATGSRSRSPPDSCSSRSCLR